MSIIREFIVDSRDRISGTNEAFTITIPESLKCEKFQVKHVSIPNTFYNINSHNKYIDIIEPAGAGTEVSIALTEGFYLIDTLDTAITAALNGAGLTGTYDFTYNETIEKIIISTTNAVIFNILWNTGTHSTTNMKNLLGFVGTSDSTGATTYTGENLYNLGYESYILIKSSSIGQKRNIFMSSVVAMVQTTNSHGEYIFLRDIVLAPECIVADGYKTSLSFNLTFYNDLTVDLNGIPWSMILKLYCTT